MFQRSCLTFDADDVVNLRLTLDDPIIRWYHAWRGVRSATVRDLLGHTAGTKDFTDAALARLDRRGRPLTVGASLAHVPQATAG